ncbi:Transcriptional adapter 1 [Lamellibrachia satsuma]|nr:Transcriptional adapter 1 [Lamellibrachia satsuma]
MSTSTDLVTAKKKLAESLGDTMTLYLQILSSWFKRKISREDFDHEARKLLPKDAVHLHNQFLLAILTKCHSVGASIASSHSSSRHSSHCATVKLLKKAKGKKLSTQPKVIYQQRFLPANPLSQAPQIHPHVPEPEERGPDYASREMCLPDIGLVHGRMIVTAWDFGLDDVEDAAVKLVMEGVQMALKNILTVIFARRNAYKLREHRMRYAVGAQFTPTYLRNHALLRDDYDNSESGSEPGTHTSGQWPSVEMGEHDAAIQLACPETPTHSAITLFDLFDALQVHRSAIPSHTVYAKNMERISNHLWHPSNEELGVDTRRQEQLQACNLVA